VLSTHGGFFHTDFARALKTAWFQTATRLLVRSVDALVYTSDQDRDLFARITQRGVLLRSAVDLDPWLPLSPEPVPGAWVTTGRVDSHKGIANLLRTLAAVRDRDPRPFRADVIGPEVVPGLMDDLSRQRDALGLNERVAFSGKVPFARLQESVRTAELGLFPSEYESFGLSVVEAMAAGVVPVLNDIAAFRYFIDEGVNGFVVDYAQPERAAATILRARDLGAARPSVSAAARASSRKYGWDVVVGQVEELYRESIARRASAAR
jgi:alpha-1,3-mannosyltransferase